MKIKILATLIMLLVVSSTIQLALAVGTCGTPDPLIGNSLKTVEVEKKIKSTNSWVDEIEANIGDILRFRIKVTYHDTDGDGPGYKLKNITVVDRLPFGLEYMGDATPPEDDVSEDGENITWVLPDILYDDDNCSIEFNVKVVNAGEFFNMANVSAIESCYGAQRWGEDSAKVSTNQHDDTPPSLEITKPKKKWLYRNDQEIIPLFFVTRIIGPLTIEVNAADESGIEKVEFIINGKLEGNDTNAPYNWNWDPKIFLVGIKKIKVKVYDKAGNDNSVELFIFKMPNHPLIATGVIVGTGLLLKKLLGKTQTTEPTQKPVNNAPTADVGGAYNGTVGKPVSFDGSNSSDPDDDILKYEWDFGDGSTGIGEKPLHTYNIDGEFTVTLTVTDSAGVSNTDTTTVKITKSSSGEGGTGSAEEMAKEGNIFWYIVGGLGLALLVSLVVLLARRKFYV